LCCRFGYELAGGSVEDLLEAVSSRPASSLASSSSSAIDAFNFAISSRKARSALRPTLATTGGKLIVLSSPYGQSGALSANHDDLCLGGPDENRFALAPRAAHDHTRQAVWAGSQDRCLLEAVAEHLPCEILGSDAAGKLLSRRSLLLQGSRYPKSEIERSTSRAHARACRCGAHPQAVVRPASSFTGR
jgi:hypothetical protein